MKRRVGDPDDLQFDRTFVKERFFAMAEGWFYECRALPPYGPFSSREKAEENCRDRFSEDLGPDWSF